ncbi:MAG: hypothetical protein JW900_12065, partial [Anaerolineae bacterium]|nr:hypothetical protein [Anaerolineae bacterium]
AQGFEMAHLAVDTSPEIEQLQTERLRQMPVWRKVALMSQMGETVRLLAQAGVRQRYAHETPEQQRRRLADLLLGPGLAALVYDPLVEKNDTGTD